MASSVDSDKGPRYFEYDADHRLVAQHDSRGELRYAYDPAGNLISSSRHRLIEYDQGNLIQHADFDHYEHDLRRRRSKHDRQGGPIVCYTYDSLDQLVEVRWDDRAPLWRAAYDGVGRRLWREYDSHRTDFYWDGDRLAAERVPRRADFASTSIPMKTPSFRSCGSTTRATRRLGRRQSHSISSRLPPACRCASRTPRARHLARSQRDAYGELSEFVGRQCPTRLRFAGHFFDEHLGISLQPLSSTTIPALGRYLQPDPLGHRGRTSTSLPIRDEPARGRRPTRVDAPSRAETTPAAAGQQNQARRHVNALTRAAPRSSRPSAKKAGLSQLGSMAIRSALPLQEELNKCPSTIERRHASQPKRDEPRSSTRSTILDTSTGLSRRQVNPRPTAGFAAPNPETSSGQPEKLPGFSAS